MIEVIVQCPGTQVWEALEDHLLASSTKAFPIFFTECLSRVNQLLLCSHTIRKLDVFRNVQILVEWIVKIFFSFLKQMASPYENEKNIWGCLVWSQKLMRSRMRSKIFTGCSTGHNYLKKFLPGLFQAIFSLFFFYVEKCEIHAKCIQWCRQVVLKTINQVRQLSCSLLWWFGMISVNLAMWKVVCKEQRNCKQLS